MPDSPSPAIMSVFHPTDLSKSSAVAFSHALKIALINKSALDILHVNAKREDEPGWSEFPQVRQTLELWGLLEKGSPRGAVLEQLGIKVRKVELGSRNPLAAITYFLEQEPPQLMVLATQGREGLPRWLKPSVSERLVRRSRIVTLFIPPGGAGFLSSESGEVNLARTLIPVDHKPDPSIAVDTAGGFLRSLGVAEPQVRALHVGGAGAQPEVAPPAGLAGSFEVVQRAGQPVEEILGAARDWQADLIVMATEGHHGFLDAFRGSTTEQVLRRAPCPLLAVPAPEA